MRDRAVLVYDGDCGICTKSAGFAARRLVPDAGVVAFQHTDLDALGLTPEECERAVQWVRPSGRVTAGHLAIGDVLRAAGGWWAPLGWLAQIPPTSWLAAVIYRWIAANRHRLPGGTPACSMPANERPGAQSSIELPGATPD